MINSAKYYPTTIDINNTERELNIKLRAYYALNDEYKKLVDNELKENAKNANPWKKLKKNVNNITSANKDYIWATSSNDNIYKCDQPCDDKKWKKVNGGLMQVSTDDTEVWGVNSSNGEWVNKPGGLSQVSADSQYVWGVNSNNNIYRANVDGNDNWTKISGKGKWISAEAENDLYLVGTDDNLYKCEKPCDAGDWNKISGDGKYKKVSGNASTDNSFIAIKNNNVGLKYKDNFVDKTGWLTKNGENNMSGLVADGGESTEDWKYLGQTDNITQCRAKAVADSTKNQNIYSSVVYNTKDATENNFAKTCYGGIKNGQTNKVTDNKAISSYPPHGVSVLGGQRGLLLLNRLKILNEEIEQLMKNYNVLTASEIKKGATYKSKTINSNEELKKLIKKLKKERIKIEDEIKKKNQFNGENDQATLTLVSNQYKYIGWTLLASVFIITTLSQLKSK